MLCATECLPLTVVFCPSAAYPPHLGIGWAKEYLVEYGVGAHHSFSPSRCHAGVHLQPLLGTSARWQLDSVNVWPWLATASASYQRSSQDKRFVYWNPGDPITPCRNGQEFSGCKARWCDTKALLLLRPLLLSGCCHSRPGAAPWPGASCTQHSLCRSYVTMVRLFGRGACQAC